MCLSIVFYVPGCFNFTPVRKWKKVEQLRCIKKAHLFFNLIIHNSPLTIHRTADLFKNTGNDPVTEDKIEFIDLP
jgi:hypothetical protein